MRPPQDPVHRVAGSLRGVLGRVRGQVDVAWSSGQWEDDRNTLPIPGAAVVDASVAVRIGGGVEAFGAAENLLDRRYLVGRAGIDRRQSRDRFHRFLDLGGGRGGAATASVGRGEARTAV